MITERKTVYCENPIQKNGKTPKLIDRETLELLPFEKRLFMEEVLIPEGTYKIREKSNAKSKTGDR